MWSWHTALGFAVYPVKPAFSLFELILVDNYCNVYNQLNSSITYLLRAVKEQPQRHFFNWKTSVLFSLSCSSTELRLLTVEMLQICSSFWTQPLFWPLKHENVGICSAHIFGDWGACLAVEASCLLVPRLFPAPQVTELTTSYHSSSWCLSSLKSTCTYMHELKNTKIYTQ